MAEYVVQASGCDDSTKVIIELDDDEVAAVRRVAAAITAASEYGCQPSLTVKDPGDEDDW